MRFCVPTSTVIIVDRKTPFRFLACKDDSGKLWLPSASVNEMGTNAYDVAARQAIKEVPGAPPVTLKKMVVRTDPTTGFESKAGLIPVSFGVPDWVFTAVGDFTVTNNETFCWLDSREVRVEESSDHSPWLCNHDLLVAAYALTTERRWILTPQQFSDMNNLRRTLHGIFGKLSVSA